MTTFSGFAEMADDLRDFADEAREAARETPAAIDRAVEATVRAMAASAAHRAPEDEGDLERLIEAYRRSLMSWGFGTDLEYGPIVEYGRGPVEAQQADALRFEIDGEVVYAQRVAAAAPQPFVRNSFNEHKSELEENINDELDAVYGRIFS